MTLTASPLDGHLVLETISNSQMALDAGIIEPLIAALAAAGSNTCPCVLEAAARALSNTAIHGTNQQVKYLIDQGCVPPLCALLLSKHTQVVMLALEGIEGICKASKADSPLCEGENETMADEAWVESVGVGAQVEVQPGYDEDWVCAHVLAVSPTNTEMQVRLTSNGAEIWIEKDIDSVRRCGSAASMAANSARCGPTLHAEAIYKAQGLVNLEALRDYEDDEDDEDDEIKFEMRDFAAFLIDTYFGNEKAMLAGVEWAETTEALMSHFVRFRDAVAEQQVDVTKSEVLAVCREKRLTLGREEWTVEVARSFRELLRLLA